MQLVIPGQVSQTYNYFAEIVGRLKMFICIKMREHYGKKRCQNKAFHAGKDCAFLKSFFLIFCKNWPSLKDFGEPLHEPRKYICLQFFLHSTNKENQADCKLNNAKLL